jgi:hypothetical protein
MDSSLVNKWNWAFLFKLIARGFGQFGATNKAEQTERGRVDGLTLTQFGNGAGKIRTL